MIINSIPYILKPASIHFIHNPYNRGLTTNRLKCLLSVHYDYTNFAREMQLLLNWLTTPPNYQTNDRLVGGGHTSSGCLYFFSFTSPFSHKSTHKRLECWWISSFFLFLFILLNKPCCPSGLISTSIENESHSTMRSNWSTTPFGVLLDKRRYDYQKRTILNRN